MNKHDIHVGSSMSLCVRNSGKLPISIQGHYDHWQRYHGRGGTDYDDGVKKHLKRLRIQRSLTKIRMKTKSELRLSRLSMRKKHNFSSKIGNIEDIFDMFDDIIDSGSSWWKGSPLPDISRLETTTDVQNDTVKQPFLIPSTFDFQIPFCSTGHCSIKEQDILQLLPPKTLHIYVASPNSDMILERMSLEYSVWPHLKRLCLQFNRELIIHDLHTFPGDLLSLSRPQYSNEIKRSMDLCMEQNSEHIKAVILFGDYLDEKEPPETLSEDDVSSIKRQIKCDICEIKRIQDKVQSLKMKQQHPKQSVQKHDSVLDVTLDIEKSSTNHGRRHKSNTEHEKINSEITSLSQTIDLLTYRTNMALIEQWYRKSSGIEGRYELQNEGNIIKELESVDPVKIKQGTVLWKRVKEQLCCITSNYIENILDQQMTTLQYELNELEKLMHRDQCIVVTRTFNNIEHSEQIKRMKINTISKISENNQRRFELKADNNGLLSPKDNWEHASYLKHLSSYLQKKLEGNIIETLEKQENVIKKRLLQLNTPLMSENNLILLFSELKVQCKALKSKSIYPADLCPEIERAASRIEELIASSEGANIVLAGPHLNGKSSVIATLVSRCKDHELENNAIFVYRILGSSFQSVTLAGLIRSICLEIIYRAGIPIKLPHEYCALKALFHQLTIMINYRVVICIDGLDLLTDITNDSNRNFNWLPIQNDNFSVILSCSIDSVAYTSLQRFIDSCNVDYSLLHIGELSNESIENVMHSYLDSQNHVLTNEQMEIVKTQCMLDRSIGFVLSNLRITKCWSETVSLPRLGTKLELNVFIFFSKLEDIYKEPIVRRLLGYITCYSNGCTINELLDVMTLDDVIQKYFASTYNCKDSRYTLPLLRCIFIELEDLLEFFLDESGLLTVKWRNTVYLKAATDRYLLQKDKAPSYHQVVSLYYMNDRDDQLILSTVAAEDATMTRYSDSLTKQNLLYSETFDRHRSHFNRRKILQLPFHLIKSPNVKMAKLVCFFNFHWLQAVVINYEYYKVIEEVTSALLVEPEDVEFAMLLSVIENCQDVLLRDPLQLNGQLLGRISDVVRQDLRSIEPQKYPSLKVLDKSIRVSNWITGITPSRSVMRHPEKTELSTLGSNVVEVTCILLDDSGAKMLAASRNNVTYTWNIADNEVVSVVLGTERNIFQMLLGDMNQTLVTASPEFVDLWDYGRGVPKHRIAVLYDLYCLTISADRTVFSALFYGICWIASWNLASNELIVSAHLPLDASRNCDGKIEISSVCKEFTVLAAVRYDNKAVLIDVRSGVINSKTLRCKEDGSAVTKVAISPRFYILGAKGLSNKDFVSIIYYIDIFDEEKLTLVRRLDGCCLDFVISLSVNTVGSHAITVNSDRNTNITDISLWNLETAEHKHYLEIPAVFEMVQCSDMARVFLLPRKTGIIYKASIQGSKNKPDLKRQSLHLWKYSVSDVYVFCCSDDNVVFDVYNVARGNCRGRKVRSLVGLAGQNDVILPFKDRLIILAERCYSPVVAECKEVFQIIKIFDLKTLNIVQKVTNVYIYPCRKHEFLILDKDILMGFSENRSYIVYWNLKTGQIQQRIRPNPEIFARANISDNVHELVIDTTLVCKDHSVLVAAYFTRYLCVFSLTEECHLVNLAGDCHLMHLQTAAITHNGKYLVQNNYSERSMSAFLTLWSTETGSVINTLPVRENVLSVAISRDAHFVGLVYGGCRGFVWNTLDKEGTLFNELGWSDNGCADQRMEFIRDDGVLVVATGRGFHFWNILHDHCAAIGSFEPDHSIQSYTFCCDDLLIAFMLKGSSEVYTLKYYRESIGGRVNKKNYLSYLESEQLSPSDNEDDAF